MFNVKSTIQRLQEESTAAINIFTATKNRLMFVNEQANSEISRRKETISDLEEEITQFSEIQVSNDKLISNINKIIE